MAEYRLLKDTPTEPKGTIYVLTYGSNPSIYYKKGDTKMLSIVYQKENVENNHEWFEKVEEVKPFVGMVIEFMTNENWDMKGHTATVTYFSYPDNKVKVGIFDISIDGFSENIKTGKWKVIPQKKEEQRYVSSADVVREFLKEERGFEICKKHKKGEINAAECLYIRDIDNPDVAAHILWLVTNFNQKLVLLEKMVQNLQNTVFELEAKLKK